MRLAASLKLGFYPAPPEAIAHVLRFVQPPDKPFSVLDPCAGEGLALNQIGAVLGCNPVNMYAVELEEEKAQIIKQNCEFSNVIAPASFFHVGCSLGVFSLIWCNPPFDSSIIEFLQTATSFLRPTGLMMLICPERCMKDYTIQRYLETWYCKKGFVKFPEGYRQYNEICIFGQKRHKMDGAYGWQNIPEVTEALPTIWEVPASDRPKRWEKLFFTDGELEQAFRDSPLRKHLEPVAERELPRPPLELGVGHIALLLASGQLDGIVRPQDEPPHVVRGTAHKKGYVSSVEEIEKESGVTTKTVMSEKIVLTVRAVGVDGEIKTFSSDSE